jgi:hypothetical protein
MWKNLSSENLNTTIPSKDYGNQKQLENVKFLPIIGDARCRREIKSTIATAKVAFCKKKNIYISKLYLNLRKKLMRCCICSINLYVAKTWIVRKIDQNYLESFKMCLEKDGHDKVNKSCERKISITQSQRRK